MKKLDTFIGLLNCVIKCAEQEKSRICKNEESSWNYDQIQGVVLPEMNELLLHANQGNLYFKYGKKQRLLESTYIITDSMKDLTNTELGKKVMELQKMYNFI